MLFEGTAWAQGVAAGTQGSAYGTLIQMAPILGIIAIFYFLLIRPQTKKASEHSKMLSELKRNDEVVTTGGILGKITELGDRVVTLEIAPNVRIRVERPQIASVSTHSKSASTKKEKAD
ncbi:MAG TPA: preprotein translocase subunit YajC [Candidatus Binataceae bacterium]|nr:preprotein translocase subunit YajC [Candidatus Binataceae bacterium]